MPTVCVERALRLSGLGAGSGSANASRFSCIVSGKSISSCGFSTSVWSKDLSGCSSASLLSGRGSVASRPCSAGEHDFSQGGSPSPAAVVSIFGRPAHTSSESPCHDLCIEKLEA